MANFGKNGPIQRFRLGRPVPQGNQQGTRVMVEKGGEGGLPLGHRMPTADEEGMVPRRMPTPNEEGMVPRRMPTPNEEEMVPGRRMPTADEERMVPGRRMPTADEEGMVPGRRLYTAEETAAGLARLTARTGKGKEAAGVKEKDFGAQEGDVEEKKKEEDEDEDEEKKKQFGGFTFGISPSARGREGTPAPSRSRIARSSHPVCVGLSRENGMMLPGDTV